MRGGGIVGRTQVSDEIGATVIDHIINHGLSLREAGHRVQTEQKHCCIHRQNFSTGTQVMLLYSLYRNIFNNILYIIVSLFLLHIFFLESKGYHSLVVEAQFLVLSRRQPL